MDILVCWYIGIYWYMSNIRYTSSETPRPYMAMDPMARPYIGILVCWYIGIYWYMRNIRYIGSETPGPGHILVYWYVGVLVYIGI